MGRLSASVLFVVLGASAPTLSMATEGDPFGSASLFASCTPPDGHTWTYERLTCLRRVGAEAGALRETRRRLLALGAGDAQHPWETLVLAHVTLDTLRRAEAIALYETAADGFVGSGDAEGEVVARQNLATQYRLRGEVERAAHHVSRALEAAEASGQPLVIARAAVLDATHSIQTGGDIRRAQRALIRADRLTPPTASIGLRRTILFSLATTHFWLGQLNDGLDALDRHRQLRREDGSPQNAATVEYNRLDALRSLGESRPRPGLRAELVAEAQRVIDLAAQLSDPLAEAQAHRLMGELLRTSEPERSEVRLRRCLAIESQLNFPKLRASCLESLSRHEWTRNPRRAEQLSRQALSLTRADKDRFLLANMWVGRLRRGWHTLAEERAVDLSWDALDAIERLRLSQPSEMGRAAIFSNWASDYNWLVGQFLQRPRPRVDDAFTVGERLRARVLLERLTHAGVPRAQANGRHSARDRVTFDITVTQKNLLQPSLHGVERRMLLERLRLLELEREDLAAGQLPALGPDDVSIASLEAVQRSLDENEAMIWFSLAPWRDLYDEFGGGSWAIAITRQAATVYPLPIGVDLDGQIAAFTGLLRQRTVDNRQWESGARGLADVLIGTVLAQLPPATTRLIIASDGPLHRLPFEALPSPTGGTLGDRFDISVTSSATVWLRLREAARRRAGDGVLVLANPDVPGGGSPDGNFSVGALPGAREEARAIARILSLPSHQVVDGSSASESFLKHAALETFGVVHVAAHARANAAYPERSAIFLTPGDTREDGWLQPHEIAALDLRGAVVVLSACDSAEGSLIPGEGPLSLARAFFAGGASAVVATRWPLRDDDAARVMEYFYRSLNEGRSVAAALRDARRRAQSDGLPPAAWAGFVVLGDGGQVPVTRSTRDFKALWVTLATLIAVGVGMVRRHHRTTSRCFSPTA